MNGLWTGEGSMVGDGVGVGVRGKVGLAVAAAGVLGPFVVSAVPVLSINTVWRRAPA